MIDLYKLELEIGYGADGEQVEMSRGEVLELIVRLRQSEKDAARYRWLCTSKIYDQFDSIDQVFYANKVDTDKVIDEVMQCNK